MEVTATVKTTINVKYLIIHAKVRDIGTYTLFDSDGNELVESEDYVPSFMPGGGGDYLKLKINIDSGEIVNWYIDPEAVAEFLERNKPE